MSVRPASLEKTIGLIAYQRCARYRIIASIFMTVAAANYVIYFFHPLHVPLPLTFPWTWWSSVLIAMVIGIPSGYLMWRGIKDAGIETLTPRKEHSLYGGIYDEIRHPQAVGEMPLWWVMAFFFFKFPVSRIVLVRLCANHDLDVLGRRARLPKQKRF